MKYIMSQNANADEPRALTDEEREMYRSPVGEESPEIDATDAHPTKDAYASEEGESSGWSIDPRTGIQRFVELYERYDAFVREDLANAETACYRRAKHALLEDGASEEEIQKLTFEEVISTARERTGYEPVIEIVYTKGEKPQYEIHDNGCGISVREWGIFKEVGLSASHFDGDRLGKFGMGWLAKYKASDMILMWTKSVFDDASYSNAITMADPEGYLPGDRDTYGTTFKMTLTDEAADNIDMRDSVEEYASNLRVPVRYEERNEDGKEIYNDDFPPLRIEETYSGNAPCVTYEDPNGMFRIVGSPKASYDAILISVGIGMPYGKKKKYNSPWQWDLRVNYEDGRIYESEIDEHIGKVPVSEQAYERLPDEKKEDHIIKDEMHESDKQLPEPTGSRDSFERHRLDEFLDHATAQLQEEFKERAEDVFEQIDTLEDILSLDPNDELVYEKGIEQALSYSVQGTTPQEKIENYTGVRLSDELCEKISDMRGTHVGYANRHESGVNKARNRYEETVKEVLKAAGTDGTVYMGQTLTQWKAELVWRAHEDNQVVYVDSDKYSRFEEKYGWKKITDVPNRNSVSKIADYFDGDVDEETVKNVTGMHSTSSRSRDPETRRIKVRYKSGRTGYKTYKPKTIKERFENDEEIKAGRYSPRVSKLVLFPTTEDRTMSRHYWMAGSDTGIGVAKCPKYVYEYLIDVDGVYAFDDLVTEHQGKTVQTSAGTQQLEDMSSDDLIVIVSDETAEFVEDNLEHLKEYINEKSSVSNWVNEDSDVATVEAEFFEDCWMSVRDMQRSGDAPTIARFGGGRPDHIRTKSLSGGSTLGLYKYIHLDDVPEDAPEMEIIDRMSKWSEESRSLVDSIARLHDTAGLASQQ